MTSPREAGYRMPAEWEPHAATWVAWPSHEELWGANLGAAQQAFVRLVAAIERGEEVHVLVADERAERAARSSLAPGRVTLHAIAFGDIWLRDTAPLFLLGAGGDLGSVRFAFNGWGGKYVLAHDAGVAAAIAKRASGRQFESPFVLEGGAVEVDGLGTVLTTRQCLRNPNRNRGMTEEEVERALRDSLGAEKVLWLSEGLLNDHTDGHVDTIARFVAPGVVVLMEARTADDPNANVLRALNEELSSLTDARGHRIEVTSVPSPGRVTDEAGRVMPASYVNFYIANAAVIVPTYGSPFDDEAVESIGRLFPERRTVRVDARAVLSGGGAFHCITQQEPRAARTSDERPPEVP